MLSYFKMKNYRNFVGEYTIDFDFDPDEPYENLSPLIIYNQRLEYHQALFDALEKFHMLMFYHEEEESFGGRFPVKEYRLKELTEYEKTQVQTLEMGLYLLGDHFHISFTSQNGNLLKVEFIKNKFEECSQVEIERCMNWSTHCFNRYEWLSHVTKEDKKPSYDTKTQNFLDTCVSTNVVLCPYLEKDRQVYNPRYMENLLPSVSQKIFIVLGYQYYIPDYYLASNVYNIKYKDQEDLTPVIDRYQDPILKIEKKPTFPINKAKEIFSRPYPSNRSSYHSRMNYAS